GIDLLYRAHTSRAEKAMSIGKDMQFHPGRVDLADPAEQSPKDLQGKFLTKIGEAAGHGLFGDGLPRKRRNNKRDRQAALHKRPDLLPEEIFVTGCFPGVERSESANDSMYRKCTHTAPPPFCAGGLQAFHSAKKETS